MRLERRSVSALQVLGVWLWTVLAPSNAFSLLKVRLARPTTTYQAVPDYHVEGALEALKVQSKLPIFDILKETRQTLREKPNLLLEAPPGTLKQNSSKKRLLKHFFVK